MTISSLDQAVETKLRTQDMRYTKTRRMVVGWLAAAPGPRSAAELYLDMDATIPLSSLYRTLAALEHTGIVVPHYGTKGLTRYELADWIAGHHHHLVCTRCGAVQDVDIPAGLEARVRDVVRELAALVGFAPTDHTLEIEGLCAECR